MKQEERDTLRREVLAARNALPEEERSGKSDVIAETLMAHPSIFRADHVFCYMHYQSEVQTTGLIIALLGAGKTVSVPCTLKDENRLLAVRITDPFSQVVPGYCGIPEPVDRLVEEEQCAPESIDVVIVPGSVFDRHGGRMGYGGGFYDRFFSNGAAAALRIGVAFELQLVDRVPMEPHDQFMDLLVTEKEIYTCRR